MLDRKEIKKRAKDIIKQRYTEMFIAFLLLSVFTSLIICGSETTYDFATGAATGTREYIGFDLGMQIKFYNETVSHVSILILILGLLLSIYKLTIGAIIQQGYIRFQMLNMDTAIKASDIFYYFSQGFKVCFNIIKIRFIMNLKIVLWCLLFIIPGVIKDLEYYMIPYLLVEDPMMSSKDVFKKSKELTNGFKADIFVFDISFIGWYLLMIIPFAKLLIMPYPNQCFAILYDDVKKLKTEVVEIE